MPNRRKTTPKDELPTLSRLARDYNREREQAAAMELAAAIGAVILPPGVEFRFIVAGEGYGDENG